MNYALIHLYKLILTRGGKVVRVEDNGNNLYIVVIEVELEYSHQLCIPLYPNQNYKTISEYIDTLIHIYDITHTQEEY